MTGNLTSWSVIGAENWLLLSDGVGQWYDGSLNLNFVAQHPDQHVGWGVEIHDVDNDGELDIWVGYGQLDVLDVQENLDLIGLYNPREQPDALFIQKDGVFVESAQEWGLDRTTISRGGIWADLNDDGFLDFVSPAVSGPVVAYLANCDESALASHTTASTKW